MTTEIDLVEAPPERACPEEDCSATFQGPALLADHLQDWHGWSDAELSLWWGR